MRSGGWVATMGQSRRVVDGFFVVLRAAGRVPGGILCFTGQNEPLAASLQPLSCFVELGNTLSCVPSQF